MSPSKPAASAQTAYLGLGSNLGDRLGNLRQALERLNRTPGLSVIAVSSAYATAPVGMAGQPDFLNLAAEIRAELEPEGLLDVCLGIEKDMGRVRTAGWTSRPIDIDVLLFGDRRIASERLGLPHPRLKERAFVLIPLAEIAPDLKLDGRTIAEWAALVDRTGVRIKPGGATSVSPCLGIEPGDTEVAPPG